MADSTSPSITIRTVPVLRFLWAGMVVLTLLAVAGQISRFVLGHGTLLGFVQKFNLDAENNVPTWFSSTCLFLCAVALAAITLLERVRRSKLAAHWFALSVVFALLSLDEEASFHEMLVDPLRALLHTNGPFFFAWVIPGGLFVIGFVITFVGFLRGLDPYTRRSFVLAGAVYVSGALGMEMVGSNYYASHGLNADATYMSLAFVEEILEMSGTILFLRALLSYVERSVGTFTVQVVGNSPQER